MEFFSTPELIEIGGYPFPIQGYKPAREEAIEYYRGVAAQENSIFISTNASTDVSGSANDFLVATDRSEHRARTRHLSPSASSI